MNEKSTNEEVIDVTPVESKAVVHQSPNPEGLISQAIEKGLSTDTIEKLMDLQDRWDKKQAKIAFDEDMAGFQGECPVIVKNKMARDESKNKDLYKYAPLDDIIAQTKELIQKYGFSYSFKTINTADKVSVTVTVKHKMGHSEESTMETGLSTRTQIMSGPQQIAATVTFNKRYAFCNAFGIMTGDEDKEEAVQSGSAKNNTANYIVLLKEALHKAGAQNLEEAVEVFNRATGLNIKKLPTTNNEAALLYAEWNNSPLNQ